MPLRTLEEDFPRGGLLDRKVTSGSIARGERLIAAGSEGENTVRIWDLATATKVEEFSQTAPVASVEFSSDSRSLLIAESLSNRAMIRGVRNGDEITTFSGHIGHVNSAVYLDGDRLVLTGSGDGTARLWDAGTGKERALLAGLANGGWLVVDPDGRFDTSDPDGGIPVHWVVDVDPLHALPLEIFMRDYYTPGLLREVLNREPVRPVRVLKSLNREQRLLTDVSAQSQGSLFATISLTLQGPNLLPDVINDAPESGVYDVRLFRDGQFVGQWPELSTDDVEMAGPITTEAELLSWRKAHEVKLNASGKATVTFHNIRLPQRAGIEKVQFTAYAFNSDRVKSLTTPPFELPVRLGRLLCAEHI